MPGEKIMYDASHRLPHAGAWKLSCSRYGSMSDSGAPHTARTLNTYLKRPLTRRETKKREAAETYHYRSNLLMGEFYRPGLTFPYCVLV